MRGLNMLVMYGILQGMQLADSTVSRSKRKLTAELLQYFSTIALSHRLWNEIADTVRKQRVPASSPSALGSETTQLLTHGRQLEV